jgi:hypothetical protein
MRIFSETRNGRLARSGTIVAGAVCALALGLHYETARPLHDVYGGGALPVGKNCFIESLAAGDDGVDVYLEAQDSSATDGPQSEQASDVTFSNFGGGREVRVVSQPAEASIDPNAAVYIAALSLSGLRALGIDPHALGTNIVEVNALVGGDKVPCGGFDVIGQGTDAPPQVHAEK